jgi:hypothetical protein
VSPLERALLDPPETRDQPDSYRVQLATECELDAEKARHDRRADRRHRDHELRWIRHARLSAGHSVSIVDLSAGGALVDSPTPLRPDSILTLLIEGRGFDESIPFRVVRCQVGSLRAGQAIYRGACEFTRRIDLPGELPSGARVLYPGRFAGTEVRAQEAVDSFDVVKPLSFTRPAPDEPQDSASASGWQKIVVRYVEGQILKGYTQDFNPGRAQFSLWPHPNAKPQERVIVLLARLKGVFFVRDFAGNPEHVERTDSEQPQHGRRIEVMLQDDEVIVGRTLNYRSDGYGFFVIPADPLANNIRVFIVSSAVRQVRFP